MIAKKFIELLTKLNQSVTQSFSGIGLVLYQGNEIKNYHRSLINQEQIVPQLSLGSVELSDYLTEISSFHHPFHDGFHFINSNGILTHICQFFSPPIDTAIANIEGQGARTLCALYGSQIEGVLMTGAISSNKTIFVFKNGRMIRE